MIRIIDATTVLKAGTAAKLQNKSWRIHGAFDLQSERFGFLELTDRQGGETRGRILVVKCEIEKRELRSLLSVREPWVRAGLQAWDGVIPRLSPREFADAGVWPARRAQPL